MRAERDEDDVVRPVRKTTERRLAYEIALGIVIGGLVLGVIDLAVGFVAAEFFMHPLQISFPFLHGQS